MVLKRSSDQVSVSWNPSAMSAFKRARQNADQGSHANGDTKDPSSEGSSIAASYSPVFKSVTPSLAPTQSPSVTDDIFRSLDSFNHEMQSLKLERAVTFEDVSLEDTPSTSTLSYQVPSIKLHMRPSFGSNPFDDDETNFADDTWHSQSSVLLPSRMTLDTWNNEQGFVLETPRVSVSPSEQLMSPPEIQRHVKESVFRQEDEVAAPSKMSEKLLLPRLL